MNNPDMPIIRFTTGYGGQCKASVTLDDVEYVLELDALKDRLIEDILEKGYTTSQTKQQKYPRININS